MMKPWSERYNLAYTELRAAENRHWEALLELIDSARIVSEDREKSARRNLESAIVLRTEARSRLVKILEEPRV